MKKIIILFFSILIGIACALPNILGYIEFRERYEPFTYRFPSDITFDEVAWYGPSASCFKEKLSLPFEADIYEYRNIPNLKYLLPIVIDGSAGYLFKSLRLARVFIHFIFPLISFLLVYILSKKLSNNSLVSCFSAVIFCTLGFGPRTFLNLFESNIAQPILFSRVSSPAITLPFLLITLIGLTKIWNNRFKIVLILTGIFGGLLFYTYYYYQLAYGLTIILLAALCMLQKRWHSFFNIVLICIISNIIAIPWYLQYFYALKLSPGFVSRHLPQFFPLISFKITANFSEIAALFIYSVFLLIGYALWKPFISANDNNSSSKFMNSAYSPVFMLCISGIILQFLVSPFLFPLIQPSHFRQHIINGFSLLIISNVIGKRLVAYSKIFRPVIIIFICALIILIFVKQINLWEYTKENFLANPAEIIAEKMLYEHTNSEDVIGIKDPLLNSAFPARLWRFRFYAGYFGLSNIGAEENIYRYLFIQKIFGLSWQEIETGSAAKIYGKQGRLLVTIPYLLSLNPLFSAERKKELSKFYESLTKDFAKTKKLDYLLCLCPDDESNMLSGAKKLDIQVALIKKERGVSLYRLIKRIA